ncbi:hypothetical protein TSAR_002684 [Trichomalopsis sarcophagae]|uniref:Uncharacterized protein n=1 Tax=Trichomalopsis sarcophagae TaxID=543379 RepID=A0A232EQ42_9HYME|nr:hypothetical protein TSAR_002684 [Trichomalopsis sarcophagae]
MLYWSRELTFKLFNLVHQYYAIKFGAFDKKINWVHEFQGKDKITELRNIFQQRYIGPIDAVLEQGVDIQAVQPRSPVLCNKIWGFGQEKSTWFTSFKARIK